LPLLGTLDGSGQRLFGWGPPTGHPDENDYWLASNMMRVRWALLLGLADDAWKVGLPGGITWIATKPTPEAAVAAAHHRLLGVEPSAKTTNALMSGLGLHGGTDFAARKDAAPLARRLLAYCAMTPEFQTR
jgi:hypothetical protein